VPSFECILFLRAFYIISSWIPGVARVGVCERLACHFFNKMIILSQWMAAVLGSAFKVEAVFIRCCALERFKNSSGSVVWQWSRGPVQRWRGHVGDLAVQEAGQLVDVDVDALGFELVGDHSAVGLEAEMHLSP
jgi:hypothetical protein